MTKYPKDGRVYIDHILDEIDAMTEFVSDGSRDKKTYYAVIRCFEVIGEATNKMPKDFKEAHPDFPWQKMIGMRNILIHDYLGIDDNDLWNTIKYDVPSLKKQLSELKEKLKDKE